MVLAAINLTLDLRSPGLDLLGGPWVLSEMGEEVDAPSLDALLELEGLDAAGVFVNWVLWPGADWSLMMKLADVLNVG